MSAAAFQHAEFECADAATLVSLNAVVLSAAHLKTTKRVMAEMPAPAWIDPLTREPALRGLARAAGFGDDAKIGAALYERVTALAHWIEANDPNRQSDMEALFEAAARFPMSALAGGLGFDPAGFQELVLFIEELPW